LTGEDKGANLSREGRGKLKIKTKTKTKTKLMEVAMMKRILSIIGLTAVAVVFALAQITVDGVISESQYALVAQKLNTNSGFGSNIDVQKIYVYPDVLNSVLYIGVVCKLDVSNDNGIGIWLNVTGTGSPTGASAGTSLGGIQPGTGGHYLATSTNADFKAGFEVDYMFAINPGSSSTNCYVDAASRIGTPARVYLGNCGQSGNPLNYSTTGTVFQSGYTITFAFNNSGGTNTGFEIKIPFGAIGANSSHSIQLFAFVVSATAYFSDVTVPGNVTGGNPGFNTDFGSLSGGPYYTADISLPVQAVSLVAITGNSKVTLVWETGSEFNNAGFEIYRKAQDETDFKYIAGYQTNPELRGLGTSSHGKRYTYTDENVKGGATYVYKIYAVDFTGNRQEFGSITANVVAEIPNKYVLYQNYPNPFNPGTEIRFDLQKSGNVKLEIFNSLGERVAVLYDGFMEAGYGKVVRWNANGFPSGVYYYRLTADGFVDVKKMVLMK
jgi:hypothetical protein